MTRAAMLALVLIAGCGSPSTLSLWRDDFEDVCEGDACRWTQLRGPDGAASIGESLPGDRALVLEGEGVVARGTSAMQLASPRNLESIGLRTIARCDRGSSLHVTFTFSSSDPARPFEAEAGLAPQPGWAPLPDQALVPATGIDPFTTALFGVVAVVIEKRGEGTCEIAQLRLIDRQFF